MRYILKKTYSFAKNCLLMKRFSLTIVSLCFLCITSFAQETVSPAAAELFNGFFSKLSPEEKNTIAQLSPFTLNPKDKKLYTKESGIAIDVKVYTFDLTNDGIEEIGIIYRPLESDDKKDIISMLFVKQPNDNYKKNLDESGEFYFLNVNSLAFPDIYVRNTSVGLPTYRWNGKQYIKHTSLDPKRLKRYVVSSMTQASKAYNNSLIGE